MGRKLAGIITKKRSESLKVSYRGIHALDTPALLDSRSVSHYLEGRFKRCSSLEEEEEKKKKTLHLPNSVSTEAGANRNPVIFVLLCFDFVFALDLLISGGGGGESSLFLF